ncbi:hypothetical protein C7999DRAFT_32236 [Corynascus novoguineensis]|uniref:C2H2-type domain-containing protein n=1 Tax=Corynascus novoguineensis TaxID=1126955 RepID=A0AAN7CS82_9PEZI|nr:hypothetical protein C7999DRAFT_32236 [Corynascus novoguineensis]
MRRDVEKWRYSLLHDSNSERSSSWHDGPASRLSTAASELFRLLLDEAPLQTSKLVVRTLQREYSCLQLWCDGYGLTTGDLDAVLANSKRLRYSTIRLLVSVCYTLADKLAAVLLPGLNAVSQERLKNKAARTKDIAEAAVFSIPSTDSDSDDSDTESVSSEVHELYTIEDIIGDLKTDIQCLVDLGPRYREPILDRTVKEEPATPHQDTTWDPVESLTARIRHRYPNVDGAFARVLGQANWERAQRLFAAKEKNAENADRPNVKDESASRPPGTVLASEFYDSGLGTSIPTATLYAETVFSYHGTKGGSIKIPPIPAEGQDGKPFMRHVLSDLQPYVCVVPSCSFSRVPFSQKTAWMRHLELEHGFARASHEIECPFCQEHIDGGNASHLARHLEEVSLTILPADAESNEDSDRNSDEASDEEEARGINTLSPRYGPVGDSPFDQDPFHSRNPTSENKPEPNEDSDRNSDKVSDKEEARGINTLPPRYGPVGDWQFVQAPFYHHNTPSPRYGLVEDSPFDQDPFHHRNTLPPRYSPVGDLPFVQGPFYSCHTTIENNPEPNEDSNRNSDEVPEEEEARGIDTVLSRYGPVGNSLFVHPSHHHNPTSENGSPVLAIMRLPKHNLPSNDIGKPAVSHEELLPVDTEDEEPYIIKCICNFTEDDGNTIYCETCDTWQHIHCYYPNNVGDALKLDFAHSCVECKPRVLNREQAVSRMYQEIQSRTWKCPFPSCMYHVYGLPTEEELVRHLKQTHSHNPSAFECPLCLSVFHGEGGLRQHIKAHKMTHDEIHDGTYARTETDGEGFGQTMPDNGAAKKIDAATLDATAQKTNATTRRNPAEIIRAEDWKRVEAGDVSTQAALHREVITTDQTTDSEETVTAPRGTLGDRLKASLGDGRGKRMF